MSKREKASFVINLLGTIRARNNNKRRTRLVRTLESEIRCKVLFRVEKNLSPFSRNNCDSVEIPRIPGWPCSLFLVGTIIITGQSFLHQVCGHTSGHTFFFRPLASRVRTYASLSFSAARMWHSISLNHVDSVVSVPNALNAHN